MKKEAKRLRLREITKLTGDTVVGSNDPGDSWQILIQSLEKEIILEFKFTGDEEKLSYNLYDDSNGETADNRIFEAKQAKPDATVEEQAYFINYIKEMNGCDFQIISENNKYV